MSVCECSLTRARARAQVVDTFRQVVKDAGMPCALMLDTKGPEVGGLCLCFVLLFQLRLATFRFAPS